MWTWQFGLNDILTTATIVSIVCGAGYRLLVSPMNDRMNSLVETLKELKEEIKLSREQRAKQYSAHVQLKARVDGLEDRFDEMRDDLHAHISKTH
nr:MAG TPA: PilA, PilC, PilN, PilO, PilM, pilus, ring, membrane channel [Caudoviricetes sp.]